MFFHLKINTPSGLYFDGEVESMTIRTSNGELTILAHHQEMIANVEISKLLLRSKGNSHVFACGGGVLTCKDNEVHLLINSIEAPDEIDVARALKEKEDAEKLKVVANSAEEIKLAEYKLQKALNRLKVSEKDL